MKIWKKRYLPRPRLQFTWEKLEENYKEGYNWICKYELVIELGKYDIRNPHEYKKKGEMFLSLGGTYTGSSPDFTPLREGYLDTPFRDTYHAVVDSKQLNNLPIFIKYNDIIIDFNEQRKELDGEK